MKRAPYEAPQVQTVSSKRILEVLGPAVAGYGGGLGRGGGIEGLTSQGGGGGYWDD